MIKLLAAGFLALAILLFGAALHLTPRAPLAPAMTGPLPLDPSHLTPQQRIDAAFDCLRIARHNGGACD